MLFSTGQRTQEISEWKTDNLLTPLDCEQYGTSKHVKQVREMLNNVLVNDRTFSVTDTINIRNYLMFMIAIGNATRASNLINMTLYDVEHSYKDEEYPGNPHNIFLLVTPLCFAQLCLHLLRICISATSTMRTICSHWFWKHK